MSDPHEILPRTREFNRRQFLTGLACAGLAAGGLTGCGGSSGGSPGAGPGGTPSHPTETLDFSSDLPTARVQGRVELSQFSGAGLEVVSAHSDAGILDSSGNFATSVSTKGSQVLLLIDQSGVLRGMTLAIPRQGQPGNLVVNTESTAMALAFLTPGILTGDPAESLAASTRLVSMPEFQALVTFLGERLPTQPLSDLLQSSALEGRREALLAAFLGSLPETVQGRGETDPNDTGAPKATVTRAPEAPAELPKDELPLNHPVFVAQPLTPQTPAKILNNGLRFVNVIRQELDANGNEVTFSAARLTDVTNPFPSQPNFMAGVNGVSWGAIFTGQALQGSGATNPLDLSARPETRKIVYWFQGMGNGQTLRNPGDRVQTVASKLPETFGEPDFDPDPFRHLFMTMTFYAVFPWMDMLTGGSSDLAKHGIPLAVKIYEKLGTPTQIVNLKAAIDSNANGNGFDNIISVAVDAAKGIAIDAIDLAKRDLVALVEGGISFGKIFKLMGFLLAKLSSSIDIGFAILNKKSFEDSIRTSTTYGKVVLDVAGPGLHPLPPGVEGVHGVNALGSVLYNGNGGLFLKRFANVPQLLSTAHSVAAALNNFDDVIFKDGNTQDVIFLSRAGQRLNFLPPQGSRGNTNDFLPLFLNDTVRAAGTYTSSNGFIDVWANGKTDLAEKDTQTLSLAILSRIDPLANVSLVAYNNQNVLVGDAIRTVQSQGVILGDPHNIFDKDQFTGQSIFVSWAFNVDTDGGFLKLEPEEGARTVTDANLPNPTVEQQPRPTYVDINNRGHFLNKTPISITGGGPTLPAGLSQVLAINDDDEVIGVGAAGHVLVSSGTARTIAQLIPAGFQNPGGLTWAATPREHGLFRGKFAVVRGGPGNQFFLLAMA